MPIGRFVLVLHGHLPYVLRHGTWPHGEDWLFEAAAGTYLPLLDVVGHCLLHRAPPRIVVGLTPILLEQLSSERFRTGFRAYLADRLERARADHADFTEQQEPHLAWLASRWEERFTHLIERFEAIDGDIPGAFARHHRDGVLQILTSAATHGYLPLLYEDASVRAQLRAGLATSERVLGFRPTGMWLPECAYRPGGPWDAPNHWAGKTDRIGIEHLVADEGITHTFLEHHLVEQARSEFVRNGEWHRVDWSEAEKYRSRGWRDIHQPHLVNSDGTGPGRLAVFARDPVVCEKVWSGDIGYPADGVYLEFHKRHGARRGLNYWKITGTDVDLGDKHLYQPDDVPGRVHEHAQHFCRQVRDALHARREATGRDGVVVATFDAELFGHWWFEGPEFLRDVVLSMNEDPDVEMCTAEALLADWEPDTTVALPRGSWGDGGDDRVWTSPQVLWMWDVAYRCETDFGRATLSLPWQERDDVRRMLEGAGRELLLLQASDWPFVITRGQAVDYGIQRFVQHVARFDLYRELAHRLADDPDALDALTDEERVRLKEAEVSDPVFPDLDLGWWHM